MRENNPPDPLLLFHNPGHGPYHQVAVTPVSQGTQPDAKSLPTPEERGCKLDFGQHRLSHIAMADDRCLNMERP